MRGISKEMGFNKGCFWRICEDIPELANRYARARDVQAHDHFERIIDLAKQVENGEIDPQAAKVAIDARKWAACKLMPRKYGDKIEIDQKVTHEVGDSVLALIGAMRVEQERVALLDSQPAVDAEIIESSPQVEISQAPTPLIVTEEEVC